MVESGIPDAAAADAPPLRKLCVSKFLLGITDLITRESLLRVRNVPSAYANRGPVLKG